LLFFLPLSFAMLVSFLWQFHTLVLNSQVNRLGRRLDGSIDPLLADLGFSSICLFNRTSSFSSLNYPCAPFTYISLN
jgi:hypothetical protein